MPDSPPRGGGGVAASSGTPPRGASIDARLAEMPEDLSEGQISNCIFFDLPERLVQERLLARRGI